MNKTIITIAILTFLGGFLGWFVSWEDTLAKASDLGLTNMRLEMKILSDEQRILTGQIETLRWDEKNNGLDREDSRLLSVKILRLKEIEDLKLIEINKLKE